MNRQNPPILFSRPNRTNLPPRQNLIILPSRKKCTTISPSSANSTSTPEWIYWQSFIYKTKQISQEDFIANHQPILEQFARTHGLYSLLWNRMYPNHLFHMASSSNNLHVLQFFLNKGIDVDFIANENSALMFAIMHQHKLCAQTLIRAGASITVDILNKIILMHNMNFKSDFLPTLFEEIVLLDLDISSAKEKLSAEKLMIINNKIKMAKLALLEKTTLELKNLAEIFSKKQTIFSTEDSMSLSIDGINILLTEHTMNQAIDLLEKQNDALSYLACGLLLQGYIENALPERLDEKSNEFEVYMRKRYHDAIDYYIKSINTNPEHTPVINQLLWELKTLGPTSIQKRLSSFDLKPSVFLNYEAFSHDAVKLPHDSLKKEMLIKKKYN